MVRGLMLVLMAALGISVPAAAQEHFVCPERLKACVQEGWEVYVMRSPILNTKPGLAAPPAGSRVTLTHAFDERLGGGFPEIMHDRENSQGATLQWEWDLRGMPTNGVYVSCIYKGEALRYMRRPLSADIAKCRATMALTAVAHMTMSCERDRLDDFTVPRTSGDGIALRD